MANEENRVPESLVHLEARMTELEAQGYAPSAWADELASALEGAVYPLDREELVWVARENETGGTLLSLLSEVPNALYRSREEVLRAIEQRAVASESRR